MARKRRFSTFSLSFLDIMSCGFGAVALVFLIIKHDVDSQQGITNQDLSAEVNLLEEDIRSGEADKVRARNTLSALDQQMAEAAGQASRITEDIKSARQRIETLLADQPQESITELREQVSELEQEKARLEEEETRRGNDTRAYTGVGNRQYLTGLKLDGTHLLVLLDASASMLDERLVNIIRKRNMDVDTRRSSGKWQRALATVDWLSTQFPQQSYYQILTFNTGTQAAIPSSGGAWLEAANEAELEQSLLNLRETVPGGGTSLAQLFQSVSRMNPLPDNIYLITDGLPTQGLVPPKSNTIDSRARLKLFNQAVELLPQGIPVNVILAPMEGDPLAAAAFWELAQVTNGSFMSPSKDWP